MPILFSPDATFDYILEEDRELSDDAIGKMTFQLRVLTVGELAAVEDALAAYRTEDEAVQIKSGSQVLTILKLGLAGWSGAVQVNPDWNEGDAEEDKYQDVPFKTRKARKHEAHGNDNRVVPTNTTLDMIEPKHRKELAEAITERNRMSKAEAGN